MNIYALKFREKGEKEYLTLLIPAIDHTEMAKKWDEWLETEGQYYDIDKRTVSWSGDSIPLTMRGRPFMIHTNLDGLT